MAEQKTDPFAAYVKSNSKPKTETKPVSDPFAAFTVDKSESPGWMNKIWDLATTSLLPDLPEREAATPENTSSFPVEAAKEIGRGIYDEIIKPTISPAGMALSMLPIGRIAKAGIELIPSGKALTNVLTKDLFDWAGTKAAASGPFKATAYRGSKEGETLTGKFFSPDENIAKQYGNVQKKELLFNKPLMADNWMVAKEQLGLNQSATMDDLLKAAKEVGHDGIVFKNHNGAQEFVDLTESPNSVIGRLHKALDDSKPLTNEQADIYRVERAEKFSRAKNVPIKDAESAKKFMSEFSGAHTKVQQSPLELTQGDVDNLYSMVGEALKADVIDTPQSAQVIHGLRTLLEGGVPVKSQIETMEKVFGSGLVERLPQEESLRRLIFGNVSTAKALVASIDLGIPFRQAAQHFGQKEWFGMLWPTVKAYVSEGRGNEVLQAITDQPMYDLMKRAGLAIGKGDMKSERVLESAINSMPGVKNSNRAYQVGISKLRSDLFNTMYKDYDRLFKSTMEAAAGDKELEAVAQMSNPNNLAVARKMADLINTSTGRGTLGRLEPIAEELNATLFSPRLMSSRMKSINRTLNPMAYYNGDPVSRKYALKQLISLTGLAMTTGALYKAAGAEIELDPRSADFLKGKFGNTRLDMGGGYLQYIVPTAKILSSFGQDIQDATGIDLGIDHSAVNTRTGKGYDLSGKYGKTSRTDVLWNFLSNKEAPIASLLLATMRGVEPSGKEVDFTNANPYENTAVKTFIPFMIQDFRELMEEDPSLIPLMVPAALGGNVMVYEDRKPNKKLGQR